MSYAVGEHFDKFIRDQVRAGRYNNASEVVREGLRLVEEREAKLKALREHIDAAIERGGSYSDDDIAKALIADTDQ
ncbi:MAG: type II toxin-antitoxin system ParD family antitoxin [Nitrospinae bacterium]|nr:type II toxin-antitoxin system ParD family antitoxin [Nitrospinota bacterium]